MADPRFMFFPVIALVFLTVVVCLVMFVQRTGALKRHRARPQELVDPQRWDTVFRGIENASENFENLFEFPVLFYVLIITVYVTGMADGFFYVGAWVYVLFRVAHSAIHCTYDRVMHRFAVFAGSCLVLWALWARLALLLFGALQPN